MSAFGRLQASATEIRSATREKFLSCCHIRQLVAFVGYSLENSVALCGATDRAAQERENTVRTYNQLNSRFRSNTDGGFSETNGSIRSPQYNAWIEWATRQAALGCAPISRVFACCCFSHPFCGAAGRQ